jgi:WXG100 family type VII secretion target
MSGYSVSFPALDSASAAVAATAESLAGELTGLVATLEGVLGTEWRGPAAAAFEREWSLWRRAAAGAIRALDTLTVRLATGEDGYRVTDDGVRAEAR